MKVASMQRYRLPAPLDSLEIASVGVPVLFWIQTAIVLLGRYSQGHFATFPSFPVIIVALRSSGRGFQPHPFTFIFLIAELRGKQTTTCTLIYLTSGEK